MLPGLLQLPVIAAYSIIPVLFSGGARLTFCFSLFCGYSTGGVVLATKDGRIVLENTLDARLEVVFKQQLPEVCENSAQ